MSLHDIFMQRAALEHQNMLNSDNAGIVLQSLAEGVAKGIAEEHQRMKAQRDAEEQQKKSIEQFNALEKSGYKIKRSITSVDGKTTIKSEAIDPLDYAAEESYKQESLKIRRDNLDQKIEEERRRILTQKLNNARQIGGIIKPDEMEKLNTDVGFDLGTDLNTGRIEQTPEGNFRILSNEEYSKKSDIIKSVKDSESGLNIVMNDVEQVSRLFDEITPNLKGPIEGRTKGPVQGFFGNTGVRVYEDMKKAFIGNISRSILLEKGVLTDKDVERAAGLLPKLEDTEEIKTKKINEIQNLLQTRYNEFKRRQELGIVTLSNDGRQSSGSSNGTRNFNSEAEAEAANLPSGTRITINGRPAIWE